MQTEIYSKTVTLNFTQCYANGRLKYSELNNLLQLTASEHAEILGFGYQAMASQSQSWVLSRIRMEIDRLPKFLEEITVKTWVQDFLGNRSIRNFEVYRKDKKIIGVCSFWAVFNTQLRRSENLAIKVDPAIVLPERSATQESFKRIEQDTDYDQTSSYLSKLSDLDIVNHVNNVKYTDWCFDLLPAETVLKKTFRSIDINYLKELKLAEAVDIHQRVHPESAHFAITRADKTIFLMQANF
ncbi:acyl-[acyl-carrier-protein] thioesterase [Sphingobacterium paludis]|uniref:Acyl-ACP thioesterase n=1 Tax=Sphingobacterium paludis TaxID=1476465 RepID=A0A4R7CW07_9SPHI|nr:acyl-ACP thioesterase domain-containing protein [Sphingobacterium paludis]TDS11831.1 acyl-ACP thioesterase [Sphingobacterium paludis]